VVFHLGAGARASLFREDRMRSWTYRATRPLERIPARPESLRRGKARVVAWLRRPSERRIIERNQAVADRVRAWLTADPDALIDFLRTGRTNEQTPAWAVADAAAR
jgi:hypothetical protein